MIQYLIQRVKVFRFLNFGRLDHCFVYSFVRLLASDSHTRRGQIVLCEFNYEICDKEKPICMLNVYVEYTISTERKREKEREREQVISVTT
jgi:hypothetical protein